MANDTTTQTPETQEWNPVEAVKSKYPDIGMQDHEIAQTLQDPAKFRSAFPEYTGVTDEDIKTRVGKFVDSRPEYQAPVGGKGSEVKAAGEGKLVTSADPKMNDGGVKYRGITQSVLPAGHVEKAAGEYAQAPTTLAESNSPTLTGMKKFGAGMVADTAKAAKDMFTSPLGIATLGLGPLAESVPKVAAAAEELPVVGQYARPVAQAAAKYAEPAVRWLGRIAGAGMAGTGGVEAYQGVKEGNPSKTLSGLSSVALGSSGAFYPEGGSPDDHAFDAGRARKQAKGALPTIAVPKGIQPAAQTGEALAGSPLKNPLGTIKTPEVMRASESGEALATMPKSRSAELGVITTPKALPASETGEALATRKVPDQPITPQTVEASRERLGLSNKVGTEEGAKKDTELFEKAKTELGPNATISEVAKRAQEMKTGYTGPERRAAAPEKFSGKERRSPLEQSPFDVTEGANETIARDKNMPKHPAEEHNEVAKSADAFNKERGLPAIKPEKSKVSDDVSKIADEFDKMKHDPTNPEVKKSYDALKKDIKDQWNYATQKMGINIEPTDKDPYGFTGDTPAHDELTNDVKTNKHMGVWRGGNPLPADHPLAEVDPETGESYNTMLRAIHDIFGHVAQGHDFSEPGEESAWKAHMQMMSPEARPAMTTETRGQTSWFFNNKNKPGTFAEQKAGLMPEWTSNPEGKAGAAEMEPSAVLDHIKNGKDYAILQSENPDNTRISDEENAKRTADLKKDLIERGYKPQEVGGNTKDVEGQTEHAFFVPDIKAKDALELGKKYGQAGILTNEGLHDLKTGETTPVDSKNMMTGDKARQQGYFTQVGDQVFSLPFKEEAPAKAAEETTGLSESEKRALSHRIGEKAAADMSPEGQERAMRLVKVTNQQLADFANTNGPDNPKGVNVDWTAKDFARKGSDLSPNKKLVFEHIQNNIPHKEFMEQSKDWGTAQKVEGKGPAPKATTATARMSDAELKEKGFTQEDIDAGKHLPPVEGGTAATTALAKEKGIPEAISKHMTPQEIAGVTKTPKSEEKFINTMSKIPAVQEYIDIALAGEGARKWYQRSSNAFDEMQKASPDYFNKADDKDKFIGMLAGSSPRQSVAMNLREALGAWKSYVDAGRPEVSEVKWKDFVKQAKDAYKEAGSPEGKTFWDFKPTGDQWKTEKLLSESFTPALSKVPNVIKALRGEDMWPDLTKNSNFKVPSFANNLKGWLNSVTNDGWMSLFAGLDPRDISKPESYHPIAVATRAAAKELGWEPAEAQAAIWSFTQALTERGETDPNIIRQYSQDFADLMAHDHVTRELLEDLGVNLGQLDDRLKAAGEKPEVSGRTTATTSRSVGKLKERIEEARGKGAIPPSKSAQGEINFREGHPVRSRDTGTEFNPEELGKEKSATPLTDAMVKKYGKDGGPLQASFVTPDGGRIPVQDHDNAVQEAAGYEAGTVEAGDLRRENYINDEKAVRQRFRTDRRGKALVFSVPDKVTPEQVDSMEKSMQALGDHGVLTIERAEKGGKYFDKENASISDVRQGLKDIGVLPKENATTEYNGPLKEDTAEASAQSSWRPSPNASGESSASQEAINRTASQKRQGIKTYRVDSRNPKIRIPVLGVDAADVTAGPYEHIIQVDGEGNETTMDSGRKARPLGAIKGVRG